MAGVKHRFYRFAILCATSFLLCLGLAVLPHSLLAADSGKWSKAAFPVENFQRYTSPFGYRPSPTGRGMEFHRGLDLAAPMGSYVRNWWAGQVVELSDNTACGTLIAVQSGSWKHTYCHLQGGVGRDRAGRYLNSGGILIRQGQTLPTGARIGRVGMTGRTTGPHLHWGLKYASEYVDPAKVLRAMYRQQ